MMHKIPIGFWNRTPPPDEHPMQTVHRLMDRNGRMIDKIESTLARILTTMECGNCRQLFASSCEYCPNCGVYP